MLNSEKIDIFFITETDTKNINSAEDYQIDGYKTIMPLILCLIKNAISNKFKVRLDLMSKEFSSIWIETNEMGNKKTQMFAGFYRVWTHDGKKA